MDGAAHISSRLEPMSRSDGQLASQLELYLHPHPRYATSPLCSHGSRASTRSRRPSWRARAVASSILWCALELAALHLTACDMDPHLIKIPGHAFSPPPSSPAPPSPPPTLPRPRPLLRHPSQVRHFGLSRVVLRDVVTLLRLGRSAVLRSLLDLKMMVQLA